MMGGRMGDKNVTRRGAIGQQIFQQVEQLTAGGSLNKLAAFKKISESSGRALGTVAANYYRIARKKGAPLRTRKRGRPPGTGASAVSRVTAALQIIAAALRAQEEELARLRSQQTAFDKLRLLLKR